MEIKSRKGDMPVMILVLGVFVLCALAILSFYFVNAKAIKNFQGYVVVERANSLVDEYYFYTNVGLNQEEAERILQIQDCDGQKCLAVGADADGQKITVVYFLD